MAARYADAPTRVNMAHGATCPMPCHPARCNIDRRPLMTWQTPQALDFRFGFEITMYVAAR
jgi:coenzyme PQQ precursor peptide PqqA